jgi:hypothetical protein
VFSLLVDGESPQVAPPQQSLIDVHIGNGIPPHLYRAPGWFILVTVALGLFAIAIPSKSGPPANPWISIVLGIAIGVLLAVSGFGVVPQLLRSRSRD